MLRCPILRVFEFYKEKARNVTPDADGCLVSFEVFESSESPEYGGGAQ